MSIVEYTGMIARCKHCNYAATFFKGKLTRTKCMFAHGEGPWSFGHVAETDTPIITLRDKSCNNFKLG